jgi:serine/threonine-protein kinase
MGIEARSGGRTREQTSASRTPALRHIMTADARGAFPSAAADLTGAVIGRFAVQAKLGSGGMGEVYRAEDTQLRRTVAIKRLRTDRDRRPDSAGLLREARRASALNHPRIAGVYDVFRVEDELFLVMEYVDGTTLRDRLKTPIPIQEFCTLAIQCAEAVDAAHQKGILHGDLKPANIMLTKAGDVKVCDFGLARRYPAADLSNDSISTVDVAPAGTPAYMAPEIALDRPVDLRADLFSLGVVFYEALAHRNPFAMSTVLATLDGIRSHVPEPLDRVNPHVPPRLSSLVHKLLEKEPSERYASARELVEELTAIRARLPLSSTATRLPRRTVWAAAAAGVTLCAVLGAAVLLDRREEPAAGGVIPESIHLAVLPFSVSSAEPDRRALAQGVTEILSDKLARLTVNRTLQVATVADMRSRNVRTPTEARDQLGANVVLLGALAYMGSEVRITGQLIDTAAGREIRRREVAADASDPLAVQDRVVEMAVAMIGLDLEADERAALTGHQTQVPGAHDYYLQALGYLQNFDRQESLDSAIAVFRKALAIDSRYALAYAGLGQAYWRKHELTGASTWVEPARAACEGALLIDAKLAESHACLGMVLSGTGEYERAASEFAESVRLEPTSDASYAGLATAYERLGRLSDAERTYRRAIELRPHYWAGYNALAAYFYRRAQFDDALAMFQQVVSLAPDSFRGYSSMGAVYFMQDRIPEAIASFERSLAVRPNYVAASNLGTLYFFEGEFQRSADSYRRALTLEQGSYQVWGNLAGALEAAGDRPGATNAYRRARDLVRERITVNPKDPALHIAIAGHHAGLGDLTEARASLDEVLRLGPTDAHTLFLVGVFFENRLDDRDSALLWLRRSVERGQTWREIDRSPELRRLRQDPRFQQWRRQG